MNKRQRILELADGTRTADEIAEIADTTSAYVYQVARGRLSQKPPPRPSQHKKTIRNRSIVRMRKRGHTFTFIAATFGIDPTRAMQVFRRETAMEQSKGENT